MPDLRSGALLGALGVLAVATPTAHARQTPQAQVAPGASAADRPSTGPLRVQPLGDASLAPRATPSPSAPTWACTVASVAEQRPCLLEGSTPSDQALARRDAEALSIRDALCAVAAPAPEQALCALIVDTAAAPCGAARRSTLLDDQGRFRADADTCVASLREAVTALQTLLETDASCCACLASNAARASTGAESTDVAQCLEGLAIGTPPAGLGAARVCDAVCAPVLLRQPAPGARPTSQAQRGAP